MPAIADRADIYLERFNDALARSADEPTWLLERRKRAMERFLQLGVPSLKHEEYKYTDLSGLADGQLLFATRPAGAEAALPSYAAGSASDRATAAGPQVLGRVPQGARVQSLAGALRAEPDLVQRHLAAIADYETPPSAMASLILSGVSVP